MVYVVGYVQQVWERYANVENFMSVCADGHTKVAQVGYFPTTHLLRCILVQHVPPRSTTWCEGRFYKGGQKKQQTAKDFLVLVFLT